MAVITTVNNVKLLILHQQNSHKFSILKR